MRASKITGLAVAGVLGVAGLGGVAVGGTALAVSAPTDSSTQGSSMPDSSSEDTGTPDDAGTEGSDDAGRAADRQQRIRDALSGLVGDGSLTQEQADEVAETLDGSDALGGRGGQGGPGDPGGPGHLIGRGLDAAATALGLTETEVREAVRGGQTLAELADSQGVDVQAVVDALVAEGEQELCDAVAAGRVTQVRADEIAAALPERLAEMVENGRPERGGSGRHGGFGGPDEPGDDDQDQDRVGDGTGDSSSTTPRSSSTT